MRTEPSKSGQESDDTVPDIAPVSQRVPEVPRQPRQETGPAITQPPARAITSPRNGMAVASLILGITCIIFSWWGLLTLAQAVLAIAFGAKGITRARSGSGGNGMATVGLMLGVVGLASYLTIGILSHGFFLLA